MVLNIITSVRIAYPKIKIYIWSGYTFDELLQRKDERILKILKQANYLIDGKYDASLRDITLPLRGSSNQKIIYLDNEENL